MKDDKAVNGEGRTYVIDRSGWHLILLAKNLEGCDEVFVMAATLGMGPDRLIARAQASGAMHRAVALQAAAAAMITTAQNAFLCNNPLNFSM